MVQGAAFRILACFYGSDRNSFVELCKRAGYPTDLGGYYLRQLVSGEYLEKIDRGQYQILPKGKQQLAFYYGKQMLAPKPRLAVLIIAKCADEFIVLRRGVQPFIGIVEWPAGVVNMGERLEDAAKRILTARIGVTASLEAAGTFRRIDVYEGLTFDDKVFAVFTCELPTDTKIAEHSETGDILRYNQSTLEDLPHRSKALLDFLAYAQSDNHALVERTYELGKEDLSLDD